MESISDEASNKIEERRQLRQAGQIVADNKKGNKGNDENKLGRILQNKVENIENNQQLKNKDDVL